MIVLKYAIAALTIGPLVTALALSASMSDAIVNALGPLMMLSVALVSWYLLSRGKVRASAQIMIMGVVAAVTGISVFTGGVRSPVIVIYPVIILVAGWLIDARASIALCVASTVACLTIWVAELSGLLPLASPATASVFVVHLIIVYAVSAVLAYFAVEAYKRHLRELHTASADLADYAQLLEQSNTLLERAQSVARVGSWVSDIPADQIALSAEGSQIMGIETGRVMSYRDYMQCVHPDDRTELANAWQLALSGGFIDGEHRIHVKGAVRWVRQKAELEFDESGQPMSALGIIQDITERKLTRQALHESEERYRTLIEWSPEAILVHRLGTILYANPAAQRLFGAPSMQALMGTSTQALIHPDCQALQTARMQRISQGEFVTPMVESRFLKLDGSAIDVEVQGTAIVFDGEAAIHVSIRDITERKRLQDEIRQLAFFDALTQLPNRRLLNDRLTHALSANRRNGCFGALMFLDLDNFKPLNDTHGHAVGDILLVEAAVRLRKCVREMDTVARFGGDEFVVLLAELDMDRDRSTHFALTVADKIRTAMASPYRLAAPQAPDRTLTIEHTCTISVGVVVYACTEANLHDLPKWADAAMYQAKAQGRNQVVLYDTGA